MKQLMNLKLFSLLSESRIETNNFATEMEKVYEELADTLLEKLQKEKKSANNQIRATLFMWLFLVLLIFFVHLDYINE